MKNRFSVVLTIVLMLVLVMSACVQSCAQQTQSSSEEENMDFPTHDINIVVGSGAGGGLDNFSRAVAGPASQILGVPVVVTNVQGGGGSVALTQIMDQESDGYTLFAISVDLLLNDLFKKSEYTRRNLIPVIRAQYDQSVFWVAVNSPFKTMQDVLDYAKENPGKLNFGQVGSPSTDTIIIESWAKAAGVDVTTIPFDNSTDSMAALIGGHVHIAHEEPGVAISMYEAGEIRPILVMMEERMEQFPEIPTAREMGIDLTLANWRGLFVKEGTPQDIVIKLQDAFAEALNDESYKKIAHDQLLDLRPGYLNSADFNKFIEDQYIFFEEILKDLGMI